MGSLHTEQFTVSSEGTLQSGIWLGRIHEHVGELALAFQREPYDFGFFDRAGCSFLGRCDDKIADRAPLNLSGSANQRESLGCNTGFDAGCSGFLLLPLEFSKCLDCTSLYRAARASQRQPRAGATVVRTASRTCAL
jgi:hypothetical protein